MVKIPPFGDMIGVHSIENILRKVQLTGAVAGSRPLNVIIIGPSGAGKSLLLARSAASNASQLMDFTSESLLRFCDRERPRYIICPDLNIVVSHKPSVANLTVAAMLALTGEGVSKIPGFEGQVKFKIPEGYLCGFLTACTWEMYVSKRGKWRQIGLLRRMVPLYYSYTTLTAREINDAIAKGMTPHYKPNGKWKVPDKPHIISIGKDFAERLNHLATITLQQMGWNYRTKTGETRIAQAYDYSFDLHLIFRTFAKACAIDRGDTEVREQDIVETEILSRFVRLDRPNEI